jgi:hypothetical protein
LSGLLLSALKLISRRVIVGAKNLLSGRKIFRPYSNYLLINITTAWESIPFSYSTNHLKMIGGTEIA